jgi:peptidoglycan-N-acetylglucosamine deacetylase
MTVRTWSTLAAAGAVGWAAPALAHTIPPLCDALGVHRRVAGAGAPVHLTFDDGPHPEGTPAVLATLAERRATATFFLVAEQVERFPALAREIAAEGHVVALHGYRHRSQLRRTPRALADDLRRATDIIGSTTGALAPLYRPPYGIFSAAGIALVRRRGDAPWLWSRWGRDWRAAATPDSVARLASDRLVPGDVILLHDADHYGDPGCWRATAGALPLILAAIQEGGHRTAGLAI